MIKPTNTARDSAIASAIAVRLTVLPNRRIVLILSDALPFTELAKYDTSIERQTVSCY